MHGLLRSQRLKAGLGDPPTAFTTNASESINAVLKNKVNYKKSELPVFIDKLKEAINEQDEEVLSVSAEVLSSVTTPAEVLTAIWKKASCLLPMLYCWPLAVTLIPGWLRAHLVKDLIWLFGRFRKG